MSDCVAEIISAAANVVSALATCVAAIGVWYARAQLKTSHDIAQTQFEDGLAKEYRDLVSGMPAKIFLGRSLKREEYLDAFDDLYRYFDLTNEQILLRKRGRVGLDVWESWCSGIESNMSLVSFRCAWIEIKESTCSFQELRKLEGELFKSDPKDWA